MMFCVQIGLEISKDVVAVQIGSEKSTTNAKQKISNQPLNAIGLFIKIGR